QRLTADDPLAAAALADALESARRLAIVEQMRQSASRLAQLQLGQARETEQLVLDGLKQLSESLSTRRDYELARNLDALRQAAAELRGFARRGAKAEAELDAIAVQPQETRRKELERLRRELDELGKNSQQLARR